jgi:hypothetical protein
MVKGERPMAESWLSNRMRQTSSFRGRTGCTTVPQYEVFAKVIQ